MVDKKYKKEFLYPEPGVYVDGVLVKQNNSNMDSSNQNKEKEITELLKWYATRWRDELEMEKRLGIPTSNSMAFQGVDVFGQVLMSLYTGMYGNGGKGSGYDLSDRKGKAAEIKTVCLCQPWRCEKCKTRSPWSCTTCVHCGSEQIERMNDSRFGISAAAHVKFKDFLKNYYMVTIDHQSKDIYEICAWSIDSSNKYFNDYVQTQYEHGGSTVNCLPGSYDFYMSGPTRILTSQITLSNTPTVLSLIFPNVVESMPISCLTTKEKELVSEHIKDGYICYDIVKEHLSLRKKTHGKARGNTTRHL